LSWQFASSKLPKRFASPPEAAVLLGPAVKRRLGDPVPASKVGDLGPFLMLLQDADNLHFREAALFHQSSVD